MQVRTRIAPSPTGENLHIGNAYTALINYVVARKAKGSFIIRIEDTDRSRFVPGSEKRIAESLKWLGLDYDEGPDKEGPYKPYRQSERLSLYKKYIEELIDKGHAYYCFCTPDRLMEMRKRQTEEKKPTIYDGTCKAIPAETAKKRAQKEKYVIRLSVPETGVTEFHDVIRGNISFENRLIDDQVLIKSDGFPTYHFGVVVDDHLMEISHVIRGEEWISSTPKHVLLYQAFGWDLPVYAHLPLLRNPDKSKLSKRNNPVWVSWYKEEGILPEALVNYLGLMGWSMPDGRDKFSVEEMVENFRLEDVKTTAPVFDIEKLKWLNKRYIQEMSNDRFMELLLQKKTLQSIPSIPSSSMIQTNFSAQTMHQIIPLVKPRIRTVNEYEAIGGFFHSRPKTYEMDLSKYRDVLVEIRKSLHGSIDWKASNIGQTLQTLAKKLGVKNSEFFMVLRVALTGKKISPPLNESMEILGQKEVMERMDLAMNS